jgi:parallel beta-helix repeat protein
VLRRHFTTRWWVGVMAAGAVLILLASPSARGDVLLCDKVASTTGSDSNPGSVERPFRTPRKLVESLSPAQTGCFRAGTYAQDPIDVRTSGITISSYPNERATVQGGLWIHTDRVKVQDLNLDGRNPLGLPSPTILGDDVVIQDNDITNGHTTGSCVHPTAYNGVVAERVSIIRNRIHDCGRLPATNFDHGIYFTGTAGIIDSNVIYDNADQGISLYPAAKGTVVRSNTIDGNGEGILFAGEDWDHTDLSLVTQNIVSNSRLRWNIEASWGDEAGMVNLAAGNCLWATNPDPGYNARGGVQDRQGFTAAANQVADPRYRNRAAKDFRLQPDSPCRGYGAEP